MPPFIKSKKYSIHTDIFEILFEIKSIYHLDTDTFKILSEKKCLDTDAFGKKYLDTNTFGKKYLDTDTFKILSEKVSR